MVDDNYSKVEAVTSALSSAGLKGWNSQTRVDRSGGTKWRMREAAFELLIIDLHLPSVIGSAPASNGVFNSSICSILMIRHNLPADVMFVTGREELLAEDADGCRI